MGLLRRGAKRLLKVVMERGSHVPAAAPTSTSATIREPSREPEPSWVTEPESISSGIEPEPVSEEHAKNKREQASRAQVRKLSVIRTPPSERAEA